VFDIDTTYSNADSAVVSLHYTSVDMEEGFPGNLTLYLNYVLTGENEIKLEYKAITDKPTVVNFTNHSYFNLSGSQGLILDHQIKIISDSITELGKDGLPTGLLASVAGTTYDFLQKHKIREKLNPAAWGYDINYKLRKDGNELALAAEVSEPVSGRLLSAYSTEPGMQFFTTKNAICLEMQHFPDSPNKPQFPSVVLNPGETYRQVTIYKFSVVRP
jgi:aldose 1-epimerase